MTNYNCFNCKIEFEVQGDDSVVICSKCGGFNTIDKTFRSFSGFFGFFVIICSLLVFWHAFDMSTWGNYQSLMAPQYMIFALMLLLIGVGLVAWGSKNNRERWTKYYVDQQQLLERMQAQENSKNNSEGTDEKVFHVNEMSCMGENISQTRNESNIDSTIGKDEKKENQKNTPVDILKIRMAKGEITVEEIDKIPKSFFNSGGLPNSPLEILKKRYAIGEITLDEFNKIKENLEKLS